MGRHISIYIIVLSIFLSVSCGKVDDPVYDKSEGEYISFAVPQVMVEGELDTRAMHTGASLAGESFAVWGYCQAFSPGTSNDIDEGSAISDWTLKKTLCPPTLFTPNKLTVNVAEDGYSCTYTDESTESTGGLKTWLDDERSLYTFVSLYPTECDGMSVSFAQHNGADVDAPIITYTMPYSGEVTPETYRSTPDIMIGFKQNHSKADGYIPFTFYHIMSSLSVRVNNYSEYYDERNNLCGAELKIHSIKLQGDFHKTITVDMSQSGAYSFSDSYNATYVLFDAGDSGHSVPYIDDAETPDVDETSVVLGEPLMLLCGKPGVDDPYGPGSKNQETGMKIVLDYTFNGDRKRDVKFNLINPDLSFSPQVGVNYTFQLNWIGDGLVLLIMPSSNAQWQDGEADDGDTSNDDIIFE